MMQEKQILYLHKILKENDNSIKKSIATNHICKALEPAKISTDNLAKMSKSQAKTTVIKKALNRLQIAKIKTKAPNKSKLGHLLCHQNEIHIGTRPHCMQTKQKSMCEYILSSIKNDKDKNKHLLTKCPNLQHLTTNLDYNKIMGDNQSNLRMEATRIQAPLDHIWRQTTNHM